MKVGGGLDHDDEEAAHSGAGCRSWGTPLVITPTCPSTRPHTTYDFSPVRPRGHRRLDTRRLLLLRRLSSRPPGPHSSAGRGRSRLDAKAITTRFTRRFGSNPNPPIYTGHCPPHGKSDPVARPEGRKFEGLGGAPTKSPHHHSREQSVSSGVHVLDSARVARSVDRNVIGSRQDGLRQLSMRWWSGLKPWFTPQSTAWVRLRTSILR